MGAARITKISGSQDRRRWDPALGISEGVQQELLAGVSLCDKPGEGNGVWKVRGGQLKTVCECCLGEQRKLSLAPGASLCSRC